MNTEEEQLELRNTEIIHEINDDIIARFKLLKTDLSAQKDGTVTPEILSKFREIIAKTKELSSEVELRKGNYAVERGVVRSLEVFNSPLEHIKQEYVTIQGNSEIAKIQKIQELANTALAVLEQK